MSFRFKLDEDVEKGARRIALEQIERAETSLTHDDVPPESIHGVRKSLKRVRALLRLVRSGLGDDVFKAENARYRDIGHLLAGARDRHVMRETLAGLEARHGLKVAATESVREALSRHPDPASNGAVPAAEAIPEAAKRLAQGRRVLKRLAVRPAAFSVVQDGIETGLRTCRKSFHAAYAADTDEAFHEWRKSVQHHWRHMHLVARAWPTLLTARAHEARDLSQLLGEDHDLGVLATFVTAAATGIDAKLAKDVDRLCRARQRAIRAHAHPLGQRLLAEGGEGLARRIEVYWSAAIVAERTAPALAVTATPERPKPAKNRAEAASKPLAGADT
ncbi:MAG: CHAD domain-containing protein [Hyphomicrobiaceae bacterium]